jgi:hypothetical protein
MNIHTALRPRKLSTAVKKEERKLTISKFEMVVPVGSVIPRYTCQFEGKKRRKQRIDGSTDFFKFSEDERRFKGEWTDNQSFEQTVAWTSTRSQEVKQKVR